MEARTRRAPGRRSPSDLRGRLAAFALGALVWAVLPAFAAGQELRTHAERSGWSELTPHDEVVAFYHELAARSPYARIEEIGRSRLDRPVLLVTLGRPAVADPLEAHLSGKPIVFIAAQVHGNEPAGKEGLMVFARDVAFGALSHLLDRVVLVMVPQVNPDGAEAGPTGTRTNSAGYDLNRDYLRLMNPETRAVVRRGIVRWRPHVTIDAHELTGPPRSYDFYTQHGDDLSGPQAPATLAGDGLTAAVRDAIVASGFSYSVYHTHGDPGRFVEEGVQLGLYGARNLRGYGGVHGAVSILFESLRGADPREGIERRVRMQRIALEAAVGFVAAHPGRVLAAVAEGREQMRRLGARWDSADSIAVRVDRVARGTVRYPMGEARRDGDRWVPTGRIIDVEIPFRDEAVVRLGRVRPVGYLLDAAHVELADHLLDHGLRVERLAEPTEVRVHALVVDSVSRAAAPNQGFMPRTVWTTPRPEIRTFPAGTFVIRADQPLAPIAFQRLEPEDEDSFASEGRFSAVKRVGAPLPVFRAVAWPGRMATRVVRR